MSTNIAPAVILVSTTTLLSTDVPKRPRQDTRDEPWGLVSPGQGGRSLRAAPRRGPAKSFAHYLPWGRKPDCLRPFCLQLLPSFFRSWFSLKGRKSQALNEHTYLPSGRLFMEHFSSKGHC